MPNLLTDRQRQLAHHVLLFDRPLASELAEALQRATLSCAENKLAQTGITEFVCGLFLQFRHELQVHFDGDLNALLQRTFPKHRFGDKGLLTESVLEMAASDEDEGGFGYPVSLTDNLLRLLWTATRLANAVSRKTSLKDVVAAIDLEDEWLQELHANGITPKQELRDFKDILNVVFYATVLANASCPRKMEFEIGEKIQPPFRAFLRTPSGGFAPMRTAKMTLNGKQIASISWPDHSEITFPIELLPKNTLEFEFEGPQFGSMEVMIRGAI